MKRKLDANDAPTVEVPSGVKSAAQTTPQTFESLGLDPRLRQALAKSDFSEPTSVQAKVLPLAQEGRSIIAKSKTGSGKTAAYVLPCLQHILRTKASAPTAKNTAVLVLVHTHDLSGQITKVFTKFAEFCGKDVRVLNLAQKASEQVLAAKLNEIPDVIVSTPKPVAHFLGTSALSLASLQVLVIDEADVVLSYGTEDDIDYVSKAIPSATQTFLLSATLDFGVDQLKTTFARDYAVVDIEHKEEEGQEVKQYVVKCGEENKFLLLYVIFKLKLVKGKCIIFVQDLDRSYRLKLYLEQFGIKSCILNSELPVNSRLHAVQEFNKGLYDILIAADDQEVIGGIRKRSKTGIISDDEEHEDVASDEEAPQQPAKSKKRKDFGVSRGIDFQNVSCVLNFDLPTTSKAYTHRIGRTARAGKSGMALSFVVPKDEFGKHKYTTVSSARHDERVLEKIKARQEKKGKKLLDYEFNMTRVEGFRYRMQDALKAVTPNKIREARSREIKQELLKSEKLAKHFEENPDDLKALRHDTNSSAGIIRVQNHLKHVPDYLIPGGKRQKTGTHGLVSFNKEDKKPYRKGSKGRSGRPQGRKLDPLKSFKSKRK